MAHRQELSLARQNTEFNFNCLKFDSTHYECIKIPSLLIFLLIPLILIVSCDFLLSLEAIISSMWGNGYRSTELFKFYSILNYVNILF